jgi:hypothetical protein
MRLLLAAALGLVAAPVAAQQQVVPQAEIPGSPLITARISQGATLDTNFGLEDPREGNSYFADTGLQLGLLSETEAQTLSIGLDTGLRALWEASEDFRFTFASPTTANLDYGRDWATGGVDVDLRFRQTEEGADRLIDPDEGTVGGDDLDRLGINVTQYRYDGTVDLALAQDAPSSYTFSLSGTRIDYDEVNTDRTPRDTFQGEAGWRLRFNETVSGALNGLFIYYDADNPQQTQVRFGSLDAGVIYQPSDVLRVDFGVGYAHRERREIERPNSDNPVRDTDTDTGPAARFALRYAFDDVTVDGVVRYTAAADGAPVTGQLRATYPLPRGELTGRLFQNKTGSSSGNEVRVTGAGIGLLHELDRVSSLEFNANAAQQVDETEPFEEDITRYSLSAVYSRAITATVDASLGYTYRTYDQADDDAVGNIVFFEIGKSFASRL